jgi:hypothetical protein
MELKLIKDMIAIKEVENPFLKRRTESGIILLNGISPSQETGDMEILDKIIGFGIIEIVGPDCKLVKVGDGVYYDRRNPQPVPFNDPVWVFSESNIRGYVTDENGSVQAAVDAIEEELASEQKQAVINSPLKRVL